jgi:hypothetical protein
VSRPGRPEAARTLNVTTAGAVTVGSSTSELSTDCDNGTYAVGSVGELSEIAPVLLLWLVRQRGESGYVGGVTYSASAALSESEMRPAAT